MHVNACDNIPSHCPVHALSDPVDKAFSCNCDGDHSYSCESCERIWETLDDIRSAITECKDITDKDELQFLMDLAYKNIFAWMAHQVRAHQQDLCRTNVLENMEEGHGLLVQDWAMNFLPRKFREGQKDWYSKRGWPWSISVLYVRISGILKSHVFVHIFEAAEKGATTAVAIMRHTCEVVAKEVKGLKRIRFRSDNGNGYHSVEVINSIPCIAKGLPRLQITDYDFSAPQDGKGIADSKSAIFKTHASKFINEGGKIQTPSDFKKALDSSNGVAGSSTYLCKIEQTKNSSTEKDKTQWSGPGISSLHNFKYDKKTARVHKAYCIGDGKKVTLDVPNKLKAKLKILEAPKQFHMNTPKSKYSQVRGEESEDPTQNDLFKCDVCNRSFDSYLDLSDHLSLGKHKGSISSRDKAKLIYAEKLHSGFHKQAKIHSVPMKKSSGLFPKGWALKRQEKSPAFTDEQKAFLLEKFMLGVRKKEDRANAGDVAKEMRIVKKGRRRRFQKKHFLTKEQIKGYFSRLAKEFKSKQNNNKVTKVRKTTTTTKKKGKR